MPVLFMVQRIFNEISDNLTKFGFILFDLNIENLRSNMQRNVMQGNTSAFRAERFQDQRSLHL